MRKHDKSLYLRSKSRTKSLYPDIPNTLSKETILRIQYLANCLQLFYKLWRNFPMITFYHIICAIFATNFHTSQRKNKINVDISKSSKRSMKQFIFRLTNFTIRSINYASISGNHLYRFHYIQVHFIPNILILKRSIF